MKGINFIKLLSVLIVLGSQGACKPYESTKPPDLNIDIKNFQFENYKTREEFQPAIRKILPLGTDKKFVEEVLVDKGGAKSLGITPYSKGFFEYTYAPWHQPILNFFANCQPWIVKVCYSKNGQVTLIQASTPCVSNTFKTDKEEQCNGR